MEDPRSTISRSRTSVGSPRCQTESCSVYCAYASSCHDWRMGGATGYWPAVALILMVALGLARLAV